MIIKGEIEDIIFYNEQNGYAVIKVFASGKSFTCVGNLPVVSVGEEVEFTGNMATHQKYGEQFVVENFTINAPTSREGIIRYLSSGLIKGIGPVTAKKIYDFFGKQTMDIIENHPERLSEIRGISGEKAAVMSECYKENKKMQNQIMFLQGYNISLNTAIKIYNVYKDATKQVVKENPYRLIDDVDGIGFVSADKIARNMGLDDDSPFRFRAAIVYSLKESAEKQGNTYLTYDALKDGAAKALRLDISESEIFDNVLDRLALDVAVKDFFVEGERRIALSKFYNVEKQIAGALVRFAHEGAGDCRAEELISEFERINGITFHENQKDALRAAVTQGVTVITGGPGTGKTTIVKCIAYIFEHEKLKTELCSPTGRAAKRLGETTGREAKTIHRMLGMNYAAGQLNFTFNQFNPLAADAVIVDEVSMVDVMVMHYLLRALQKGTKVILVGDKDQLPSVSAGNVLADIISSGVIDVRYLTHIYRQAEDSLIITNAHIINGGKMPKIDNKSKDFFLIEELPGITMVDTVVNLVAERLPGFCGVRGSEIQVLGPLKSGAAGIENLNKRLQARLNPPSPAKKEIRSGDILFRVGDRVMQTVNDYQLVWEKVGEKGIPERGEGVFNGDIGFISLIDDIGGLTHVTFDDNRVAEYTTLDLFNLQLAYAITIHKSQGSEFDVLVVALTNGPPTILNKNLLYTAVTRAKKTVVIVSSKKIVAMTVRNNYIARRLTMLRVFLTEENEKYEMLVSTD